MRLSRHLLLFLAAIPATSAVGQTPYKQPPREVVAILDAPPPPLALVSPTRDAMLLVEIRPYPSIELVAAPVLRLAGLRINPRLGCSQRTTQYAGITIKPLDNTPARRVAIPQGASVHSPSWSHDGKKIALVRDLEDGIELWVADAATGQMKPIAGTRLNDLLADPITWLSDNRHITSPCSYPGTAARHPPHRRPRSGLTCSRARGARARCPRFRTCSPARTTRTSSRISLPGRSPESTPRPDRSSGSARRP